MPVPVSVPMLMALPVVVVMVVGTRVMLAEPLGAPHRPAEVPVRSRVGVAVDAPAVPVAVRIVARFALRYHLMTLPPADPSWSKNRVRASPRQTRPAPRGS